jgi:hypothetical protein
MRLGIVAKRWGKETENWKIDIRCNWKLKEKDSIINPLQVQLVTVYGSKRYELWSEGCMNKGRSFK